MDLTLWLFLPKKLHHRLPTWFQMWIWLRGTVNLKRWWWVGEGGGGGGGGGGVGVQVHRIGGKYKEVEEVESNYKNSYFWWFGSDLTGSNRLCIWRKSRALAGRGSPRFLTQIMESFSADLLPAIKSYWEESHLKLFILLPLNRRAQGEHLICLPTTLRNYVKRL